MDDRQDALDTVREAVVGEPGAAVDHDHGPQTAVDPGRDDATDRGPATAVDRGPATAVDPGPATASDPGPVAAVDQDRPREAGSGRFRTLPRRILPEEMVESQDTQGVNRTGAPAGDPETQFMLRHIGA